MLDHALASRLRQPLDNHVNVGGLEADLDLVGSGVRAALRIGDGRWRILRAEAIRRGPGQQQGETQRGADATWPERRPPARRHSLNIASTAGSEIGARMAAAPGLENFGCIHSDSSFRPCGFPWCLCLEGLGWFGKERFASVARKDRQFLLLTVLFDQHAIDSDADQLDAADFATFLDHPGLPIRGAQEGAVA